MPIIFLLIHPDYCSSSSTTNDANSDTTNTTIITNNTPTKTALNTTVSPSSTKSETSATNTTTSSSQPSSLAYVYDANSSSAPFKIKEKSASSVTVVSSDSSISYWSNPLSNNNNVQTTHHLIAPMKAMEIDRIPANVLQPEHHNPQLQQSLIADILNVDDNTNNMSFLSSSVPSESITTTSNTTSTLYGHLMSPFQRVSSAPSSPTHRSRSQSLSTATGEDSSLKHLLTNLINGETSYLDQTEDVKLVRRWVKLDDHIYLANFLLILISDGLCAVVVCKDDPDKVKHI